MAYDEQLEQNLDTLVRGRRDFYRQKMFGGVGYLLRGNMCFGIWKEFLILRLGEDQARVALKNTNVRPFDITGRPMSGWVMVYPEGMKTSAGLKKWVGQAEKFVSSLPGK